MVLFFRPNLKEKKVHILLPSIDGSACDTCQIKFDTRAFLQKSRCKINYAQSNADEDSLQLWMNFSDEDSLIGGEASGHVDATPISGFTEVTRISVMYVTVLA